MSVAWHHKRLNHYNLTLLFLEQALNQYLHFWVGLYFLVTKLKGEKSM